jgi:hypothetical protein
MTTTETTDEISSPESTREMSRSGERLIGLEELALRLGLPVSVAQELVEAGHIRYFLLPPDKVRFLWSYVIEDLQSFRRVGNPFLEIEANQAGVRFPDELIEREPRTAADSQPEKG